MVIINIIIDRWQETGVPSDVRGQTRAVRVRRIPIGQLADTRPRGRAHPPATRRPSRPADDVPGQRGQRRVLRVLGRQQRRLLPMVRAAVHRNDSISYYISRSLLFLDSKRVCFFIIIIIMSFFASEIMVNEISMLFDEKRYWFSSAVSLNRRCKENYSSNYAIKKKKHKTKRKIKRMGNL